MVRIHLNASLLPELHDNPTAAHTATDAFGIIREASIPVEDPFVKPRDCSQQLMAGPPANSYVLQEHAKCYATLAVALSSTHNPVVPDTKQPAASDKVPYLE